MLFGGSSGKKPSEEPEKKMIKPRKAPIKVEPKVFFANERTFLAWMHISIVLAGASIAILAFSSSEENIGKQIYGLIMLPVAISFIVYAMYQCKFFIICVRVNVFLSTSKYSIMLIFILPFIVQTQEGRT
jgi:uncharacterized membrane protein YidH (DUF202 family)